MTHYEIFMQERGWEFKTEESLKEAYDRNWKCKHDILITKDEFVAEAQKPTERTVEEVYDALADYQFIRFDCAHMTWLWKNGNLYQVYS